jgi:hypothetical protein
MFWVLSVNKIYYMKCHFLEMTYPARELDETIDVNRQLIDAVGNNHRSRIPELLAAGADVNARTVRQITPLHIAAQRPLGYRHNLVGGWG